MKRFTSFLIFFVLMILVRSGQSVLITLGNKAYYIESQLKLNWYGAWDFCASQGMTLLTIENEQEKTLLFDYLKTTGEHNLSFWTSGNDNAVDRHFIWASTGKSFLYKNWHQGQPLNSGGKEHCVNTWPSYFDWNDVDCTLKYVFICETKKVCAPTCTYANF